MGANARIWSSHPPTPPTPLSPPTMPSPPSNAMSNAPAPRGSHSPSRPPCSSSPHAVRRARPCERGANSAAHETRTERRESAARARREAGGLRSPHSAHDSASNQRCLGSPVDPNENRHVTSSASPVPAVREVNAAAWTAFIATIAAAPAAVDPSAAAAAAAAAAATATSLALSMASSLESAESVASRSSIVHAIATSR